IEPRKKQTSRADALRRAEGNTDGCANASIRTARRGQRPWHVRTLLEREPGDPTFGHHSVAARIGKARMPKPMMHERGKSDLAIVAAKPANAVEQSAAESVEPRAGAKGNANQQSTGRAQNRATVS